MRQAPIDAANVRSSLDRLAVPLVGWREIVLSDNLVAHHLRSLVYFPRMRSMPMTCLLLCGKYEALKFSSFPRRDQCQFMHSR